MQCSVSVCPVPMMSLLLQTLCTVASHAHYVGQGLGEEMRPFLQGWVVSQTTVTQCSWLHRPQAPGSQHICLRS